MGDGHGWWQDIIYEGNLKYCNKCKLHGHNLDECRKMIMSTQERKGGNVQIDQRGNRDQPDRGKGRNQIQGDKEEERQRGNQEWVQVTNRKSKLRQGGSSPANDLVPQMVEKMGDSNPFTPILVEEGEIDNIQQPVTEVEDQEGIMETDLNSGSEQKRQSRAVLVKSNSADKLGELIGKDHMDKIPLIRSKSMSDIPVHCTERRLDYLREEFHHFHLIAKHLQKTKEETLKRLQLMEARQGQRSLLENSQQFQGEGSQIDLISQVPETQVELNKRKQAGEGSQKKKKGVPMGKKPVTRATKRFNTPNKQ